VNQNSETWNYAEMAQNLGLKGILQGVEFRAKCPFHSDQNPSFSLNTQTGLWLCHAGCGSGNFTNLVNRMMNYNVHESLEWIRTNGRRNSVQEVSRQLNVLLGLQPTPTEQEDRKWTEYYLSLDNKVMPLWFLKRGFSWSTIYHWGIHYDPLTDGIVVPVVWEEEWKGVILRPLQQMPKYQNNPGLKKSQLLFGEIYPNKDYIILVEGVLDAVWLWQLGYNTVSILGDALSFEQVQILKRYRYGEVVLALDNDEGGYKGTEAAERLLVKSGWLTPQIKVVEFPGESKYQEGYRKDAQDCSADEFKWLFNTRRRLNGF
jgi:DNA primase